MASKLYTRRHMQKRIETAYKWSRRDLARIEGRSRWIKTCSPLRHLAQHSKSHIIHIIPNYNLPASCAGSRCSVPFPCQPKPFPNPSPHSPLCCDRSVAIWLWVKTNDIPFCAPPTLEPILVVGLGVHRGYDLAFDPWPFASSKPPHPIPKAPL